MPWVDYVVFPAEDRVRVETIAHVLERVATDHDVTFEARAEENDPDPEPKPNEPAAETDPLRLPATITLPPNIVDELRAAARHAKVHVYVHRGLNL